MSHKKSPPATISIGELSERTGVSRRALRHYENEGLLASRRADNGYRWFPEAAVTRVIQIQRFISAGFSLVEIRTFPECMLMLDGAVPCPETVAAHRQRLAMIDSQMADLERRRALLKSLLKDVEPTTSPMAGAPWTM
ncbi:MerR family transcriptional regulator [Salinicola sp. CPA57]|uniref:MerR family transcriptional regulator n=1 Tax=Salinicola sp. CPA57 TaxID=1949080 RepID=UPI000DA1CBF3|nr:MerR family transcriptional regulator [Salinicola sp. CPA57]